MVYTSVYGYCWENRFVDILLSSTFVLYKLLNYEIEQSLLLCFLNFVLFNPELHLKTANPFLN